MREKEEQKAAARVAQQHKTMTGAGGKDNSSRGEEGWLPWFTRFSGVRRTQHKKFNTLPYTETSTYENSKRERNTV